MSRSVSDYLIRFEFPSIRFLILAILAFAVQTTSNVYGQDDQERIVALVNGAKITQRQVDALASAQVFPLQQQIYALRLAALESIILRTILEGEAKRQNVSVDELRKRLTGGTVEVSAAEVEKLYAENASVMGAMSPDEAKERLRLDLESQARMKNYRTALLRLRSSSTVEMNLEEPRLLLGEDDRAPSLGSKEAIVTITEFSDFQCPYCRGSQGVLKQILKEFPAEVKLRFKHLPLDIHAEAFASAQAAFCAGEQGVFWKYHDALFAADDLASDALHKLAVAQGLDLAKFDDCLASEDSRVAVRRDITEAKQFGIGGTPTFVVNGRVVGGAISFQEFRAVIERELKLTKLRLPLLKPHKE